MKARNKLLTLLILSFGTAAATALINKTIKLSATSRNVLEEPEALCYKWRLGNIHYTKTGTDKPIPLVRDLALASSGYERKNLVGKLAETYTVYTIDLPSLDRSKKPSLTYINYLYVQLLSDLIKSEMGHRMDIIASGSSAALGIMACSNSPELFNQLLFTNPEGLPSCSQVPGENAKFYKVILDLPITGILIYNITCSKQFITKEFLANYHYSPHSVKTRVIDVYHESTHLEESPKPVYASSKRNYAKCNIAAVLKKVDNNIYLSGEGAIDDIGECVEEYREYNPAVEYADVPNAKLLLHLGKPAEIFGMIQTYLS